MSVKYGLKKQLTAILDKNRILCELVDLDGNYAAHWAGEGKGGLHQYSRSMEFYLLCVYVFIMCICIYYVYMYYVYMYYVYMYYVYMYVCMHVCIVLPYPALLSSL
jgi:hypothetical protein